MMPVSYGGAAKRSVIVVGAGLAGLACALLLGERGVGVTLIEARRRLGGRATSFVDQQSGEEIDNCQHVAMGCCDAYLALLRELGASESIRWYDRQWWVLADENGGRGRGRGLVCRSVIEPAAYASLVPALFSHASSFVRASFLSVASKLAIAKAAVSISVCERAEHVEQTFGQWLRGQGQPLEAVERFWRPVVVSACNLEVDRVCAATALHVFQDGVFGGARAARIGVPSVALGRLYERAEGLLIARGGRLILGETAEEIGATSVRTRVGNDVREHRADVVVCALPFEKARRVVKADVRDGRFHAINAMGHSPILGVHLRFDRAVMDVPHAVLVERPTQWLFRKDEAGAVVHAVISAADAWMDWSEERIAAQVMEDIGACFPKSVGARLEHVRAVKERFATFAATPAFERSRPGALASDARLGSSVVLAGDYTDTGWPATMEGATLSGRAAARAVIDLLRGR